MAGIPSSLVDIHCHILPALDDGALDIRDSLAMARQASSDGISVVCATPHIRDDHDVRIDELPSRLSALQVELAAEAIPLHVVGGGEIAQRAAEHLDHRTLRRLALGAGEWILIEPNPGPLADNLKALVDRLAEEDLRVVIAHPERHAGEDFERRLRELVHRGCLIQWTAAFITEREGNPIALHFASKGLLHLLGSDAHSSHGGRPLKLRAAIEALRGRCSQDRVHWISHEAPWAVLRGLPATPPW